MGLASIVENIKLLLKTQFYKAMAEFNKQHILVSLSALINLIFYNQNLNKHGITVWYCGIT